MGTALCRPRNSQEHGKCERHPLAISDPEGCGRKDIGRGDERPERPVDDRATFVLRVQDGLITEELGQDDGVTVLKQLGLIPNA